jgi:hypothetical protein
VCAPSVSELRSFLARLKVAGEDERVEVRAYALDGPRDLEWTAFDLRQQLLELGEHELLRREDSTAPEGGLIWVFTPEFWDGGPLWIRLIEREGIVVISFHKG